MEGETTEVVHLKIRPPLPGGINTDHHGERKIPDSRDPAGG